MRTLTLLLALVLPLAGCQPADEVASSAGADSPSTDLATVDRQVVEITVNEYAFEAPAEFPSGWTTLRMTNKGEQPHFLLLWRLPADHDFEDYSEEIATPFNEMYALYHAGSLGQEQFLNQLGETLPEWFGSMQRMGGVGYLTPGRSVETTVQLEPGNYVMECYVKTPEPEVKFHNAVGMLRPLIVTEEATDAAPPEADAEITLSNYEIGLDGTLSAGEQTVEVHVTEEPEGGLVGHNVQLVRLEKDTSLQVVGAWLDWVDGLEPPAPVEFLGGSGQMRAGATSYVHLDLEPGRYAWISEGYAPKGMVYEFSVE